MGKSNIQWTDYTFNPWIGCTKVSPGCANCYAEARDRRFAQGKHWGKGAPRQRTSAANWREPLKWDKAAEAALYEYRGYASPCAADMKPVRRPRVFCASLADWLDDEVPIEWLADLLYLIFQCPSLDWLMLTKRPQNWKPRVEQVATSNFLTRGEFRFADFLKVWTRLGNPSPRFWIGTTVENQAMADERIPLLLQIPAHVRFLSCEPLLSAIEFSDVTRRADSAAVLGQKALTGIHWVICGGESGSSAREFDLRWARSLQEQCAAAGIAFFMKQMGQNPIGYNGTAPIIFKDKKGGDWTEWPEDLRVREFPKLEVPA